MIVELRDDESLPMGTVDFGGVRRDVCMAYVAEKAQVGDYVIVHVGFAISMVDAAEAQRTFRLLEELGETESSGDGKPTPSPESALPGSGSDPGTGP
jgi:hydrogenase expression/formation protein HypC